MIVDYKKLDIRISDQVDIRDITLIKFGKHIAIDSYFVCTTQLELGDYVHISPHVSVIGSKVALLKMGHFTNLATGTRVVCAGDNFLGEGLIGVGPAIPEEYRDSISGGEVIIEDMANTGANVVIFPGVTLGQGSVVGAGSIVRSNTEPWTIYAGNPAKPIKKRSWKKMFEYAITMGYNIELKHG